MTRDQIETLLTETYAARRAQDGPRCAAGFHPDIQFQIVADKVFGPIADPINGMDQLCAAMDELCATWDWSEFPVKTMVIDMVADPVRAVVNSAGVITHIPSGQRLELETLDMHTFRDGKIVEFREFFDTYKLAQVAG